MKQEDFNIALGFMLLCVCSVLGLEDPELMEWSIYHGIAFAAFGVCLGALAYGACILFASSVLVTGRATALSIVMMISFYAGHRYSQEDGLLAGAIMLVATGPGFLTIVELDRRHRASEEAKTIQKNKDRSKR